ncbi:hypothetical protein [Dyella sp. GSA-30]|uniref:hypothetical protein n=1 Tax=Dyella sp. GSA-30 TaxID=2994496 RepID=UPI0024928541|nr:hypothetical protein [Dyella sp. GSA-30]BDU23249.1 hypothetical protein DYGSA30_47060 [Dyella sp. GSA-30]
MKLSHAMLALSLTFATTACGSHMKTPDIKKNPHPKMRYELTMTIKDAPGQFDSITGFVQYEVLNKACVPETGGPMNAMRLAPQLDPPLEFTRINDSEYRATVYLDRLQDEDYYGLGVCRWSMTGVVTRLRVGKGRFSPDLSPDEVFSQKPITRYYVHADYTDRDSEGLRTGESSLSSFDQAHQIGAFSITLAAKEASL